MVRRNNKECTILNYIIKPTIGPGLVTLVLKFTVYVNLLSCAINSFAFRCQALRKKCYGNVILP